MNKKYKKAFSLIELMVFLIIGAVVIATLISVVTKKIKTTSLTLASNPKGSIYVDYTPKSKDREYNCPLIYGKGCIECDGTDCKSCDNGYFLKDNTCIKCSEYIADCLSCETASSNGTTTCTKCIQGHYLSNNKCEKCPAGQISDDGNPAQCKNCDKGTYNSYMGSSICLPCTDGTFSNEGASVCSNCNSIFLGCIKCNDVGCTECDSGCKLKSGKCECNQTTLRSGYSDINGTLFPNWFACKNNGNCGYTGTRAPINAQTYISADEVKSIQVVQYAEYNEGDYGYKWNVSSSNNTGKEAYAYAINAGGGMYDLIISSNNRYGDFFLPQNSSYLFANFKNLEKITFFDSLNTSKVANTSYMFYKTGEEVDSLGVFNIYGINVWDVSNVTNMSHMFTYAGKQAGTFKITPLNNWNVSNAKNMNSMFYYAGNGASEWGIGVLDDWRPPNQNSDLRCMFYGAAPIARQYTIVKVHNWGISKTDDVKFEDIGENCFLPYADVITGAVGQYTSAGKGLSCNDKCSELNNI